MSDKRVITEKEGVHRQWYEDAKKQTVATLPEFIRHLTEDYSHDYGTICHATAAAAIGAAHAVDHSPMGGITGFQAQAIFWEFYRGWNPFLGPSDAPARMLQFSDLLYPQMADKFEKIISKDTAEWLKAEAQKLIIEQEHANSQVVAHWQYIAAGLLPFGFKIREENNG